MKLPNLSYPFILFHLAGIAGAILYPPTLNLLLLCLGTYILKLFLITAGYHRYFSHKSFKTSRAVQFIFAFLGATVAMKSAVWWAAGHRYHHKYSDKPNDLHTPVHNPWLCYGGWVLLRHHFEVKKEFIPDLIKFPELFWLHKYNYLPLFLSFIGLYFLGGLEFVFWGGVISSLLCWHAVFIVNSFSHIWGSQPYESHDQSRNNWLIALITLGEGWHNNHHYYPHSVNNGFKWYEFDPTYYALLLMEKCGLIWDLHKAPVDKFPLKNNNAKKSSI